MFHDDSLDTESSRMRTALPRDLAERIVETAYPPFDSLPAAQGPNQDQVGIAMVKALRRWLEANELFAIVTGVVGGLAVLSMLLVFGGYLLVTR
jgi:hypothetical protein